MSLSIAGTRKRSSRFEEEAQQHRGRFFGEPGLHDEAAQLNFIAGIGLSSVHAEPPFRPVRPVEAHARHRQLRFLTHYEIGPR